MATYRLRHRYRAEPDRMFEASDDAEALTICSGFARGADYALRRGERCVALIPCDSHARLATGFA